MLAADDHPVLRAGLAALLAPIGPEMVVSQAGDAGQALALVTQHADLDVVTLDLAMAGMGGLPAISNAPIPVIAGGLVAARKRTPEEEGGVLQSCPPNSLLLPNFAR